MIKCACAEKVLKYLKTKGFVLAIASATDENTIENYKNYNRNIIDKKKSFRLYTQKEQLRN
ncbi:MAG: hypothetical protein HFJ55_02950 [Clostridia bacterium]|jgi:hypothetical protein|nr:hypothetical protein [Clostridia bacterium]